jgi:hypothetical protein
MANMEISIMATMADTTINMIKRAFEEAGYKPYRYDTGGLGVNCSNVLDAILDAIRYVTNYVINNDNIKAEDKASVISVFINIFKQHSSVNMGLGWVVYFPNLSADNVVFDNDDTNDDETDEDNEEYDAMLDRYDDYLERSNGYPTDSEEEYYNYDEVDLMIDSYTYEDHYNNDDFGDIDFTIDSDHYMYLRQDLMAAGQWDNENDCPKYVTKR